MIFLSGTKISPFKAFQANALECFRLWNFEKTWWNEFLWNALELWKISPFKVPTMANTFKFVSLTAYLLISSAIVDSVHFYEWRWIIFHVSLWINSAPQLLFWNYWISLTSLYSLLRIFSFILKVSGSQFVSHKNCHIFF